MTNATSSGPSRTAVLTAVARALHREEPPPRVLDDQLSLALTGGEGTQLRAQLIAELPRPGLLAFSRWVCVRNRFAEDTLADAAAGGAGQYVILGAGLDSFAYRQGDRVDRLRVFEVDHPATQAWKRKRLTEIGRAAPANLVYAPVDFERQTLRAGLASAGFDFAAPTVFSWIGVTMYLTLEAITATLATVAVCPPGSQIVLTYNQPRSALRGLGAQVEAVLAKMVAELGEPFVSLFQPPEIERLLLDLGFEDIAHFGPEEARARYFPDRDDVRFGGAQRLVAATVAPHPPRASTPGPPT